MPIGNIAVFDEGLFKGTVMYDSLAEGIKLTPTDRELQYAFEVEKETSKVYVVINIERKKSVEPKWRIWLNEFSLTKEFRPNIEIDSGTSYISSIIYDISPIVKRGKNVISIVYKGTESIVVDSISHVLFYPAENFETKYELYAGSLLLRPKESYEVNCSGECYLIVKNPSKDTRISVENDVVSGENEVMDLRVEKEGKIRISFDGLENIKTYGRIYSLYSFKFKIPKIDVSIETIPREGFIEIKLRNESEIDLDKILANLLINSVSVNFRTFNDVKVGQEIEYKVPISNAQKGTISLRVVGIKAGYRKIFDKVLNR